MNISEALTRMRLVFPSQSISVLTDIPQPTHRSAESNSAMGTNRGRGRKGVSSFDSGKCQLRGLDADFSLHLKFVCACKTQLLNLKFNTRNRGATHNKHSTDEGHSSETSEHLLRFWHCHKYSSLLFNCSYPSKYNHSKEICVKNLRKCEFLQLLFSS